MPEAQLKSHHTLSVHKQIGALTLQVDLELSSNWTILFGPSGSGKSSLLRAACGLLGHAGIRLIRNPGEQNEEVLQDNTRFIPPHLRYIRYAPQHAALFPHLTIRENLTFAANPYSPDTIDDLITLFRLAPLLPRRPSALSGGERHRVNLARAFAASNCRLMLLDEPFTGMDRALRNELLPQMRNYLRDRAIPVISVTHDLDEAFQLQPEVVLLRDGKVEAQGYVTKVLAEERARQLTALSSL